MDRSWITVPGTSLISTSDTSSLARTCIRRRRRNPPDRAGERGEHRLAPIGRPHPRDRQHLSFHQHPIRSRAGRRARGRFSRLDLLSRARRRPDGLSHAVPDRRHHARRRFPSGRWFESIPGEPLPLLAVVTSRHYRRWPNRRSAEKWRLPTRNGAVRRQLANSQRAPSWVRYCSLLAAASASCFCKHWPSAI